MNIVITGGGTGGHVYPGVAIAREFQHRDPRARVLFLGTAAGLESRVVPQLGLPLATLPVSGFKGKGAAKKLLSLAGAFRSLFLAAQCLRRQKADIVVGMGGYVSFPGVAAAKILGIPAAVHEQNSVPGLANRVLGKIADRIFVSYEASRPYFNARRIVFSGMPVRLPAEPLPDRPPSDRVCVFICGGSQGAHAVNRAMLGALDDLVQEKSRLAFIHQTGAADAAAVAQGYASRGFDASVHPFIDDMYGCYGRADLVVSRAGASTLAEIALCGRPSILLPYPHAAGNHQEHNARALADIGAAVMLRAPELSGASLARAIRALAGDPERRTAMAGKARLLARPDAARCVVDECCRLAAAAERS